MSNQPLTEAINALIKYSNEITGSNDQTLSEAVATLTKGYGSGGGGGWTADGIANRSEPSGEITITGDIVETSAFVNCANITKVTMQNVVNVSAAAFQDCLGLKEIIAPKLTRVGQQAFEQTALEKFETDGAVRFSSTVFNKCANLKYFSAPNAINSSSSNIFLNCIQLEFCDLGKMTDLSSAAFRNCERLSTLILRRQNSIVSMVNVNVFQNSSIQRGGAGCKIYVPSDLIENYKTDSKWSTLYGYGTITFIPIEGSEYEI